MRNALKALLVVALWAVGCASFDGRGLVPGQSTEKDVEALMGVPAFQVKGTNGDTVLYFSRQPTGRKNYAAYIRPDGVLRGVDQLLTEQNIALIVRDVSTREQVRQIVGPPWRTSRFERMGREVWEYNMVNVTQWDYFLYVQFSDDGIAREIMMVKDYTKETGGASFK